MGAASFVTTLIGIAEEDLADTLDRDVRPMAI